MGAEDNQIVDGETGFIVEPGNTDQLFGKLLWLLEHADQRREMGVRGRNRATEEFDIEKVFNRHYQNMFSATVPE